MITLDQVWFRLPIKLRRRWWRETEYAKRLASIELIDQVKKVMGKEF